jgi:RNA-binding protein 5/10
VFNFKRRAECFKCSASREESGSEGFDEISPILTKSKLIQIHSCKWQITEIIILEIMFRNLDALTTEEKVLIVLQNKIPNFVAKISKIQICRDSLTQISRGICYLNFDNLVDSMNTYQALEKINSLEIDGRESNYDKFHNKAKNNV